MKIKNREIENLMIGLNKLKSIEMIGKVKFTVRNNFNKLIDIYKLYVETLEDLNKAYIPVDENGNFIIVNLPNGGYSFMPTKEEYIAKRFDLDNIEHEIDLAFITESELEDYLIDCYTLDNLELIIK